MRTEALVYGFVLAIVAGIVMLYRERRVLPVVRFGALLAAGMGVLLAANQLLEYVTVGGSIRAGRATDKAETAGVGVVSRIKEALTTTIGFNHWAERTDWFLGFLAVALVAYATWKLLRSGREQLLLGAVAIAGAALIYVMRFAGDLGFVPGVLTASPLAVAGLVAAWPCTLLRRVLAVALGALPLVWFFQYSGGGLPQWGGRYVLLTGTLLVVAGAVVLATSTGRGRLLVVALGSRGHRLRRRLAVAALSCRRRRDGADHRSQGPGRRLPGGPPAAGGRRLLHAATALVDGDIADRGAPGRPDRTRVGCARVGADRHDRPGAAARPRRLPPRPHADDRVPARVPGPRHDVHVAGVRRRRRSLELGDELDAGGVGMTALPTAMPTGLAPAEPLTPAFAPPSPSAGAPIPFSTPDVDETDIAAVTRVLRSGWLTTGDETLALEAELAQRLGVPHVVAVSSCTAALELALRALDLPAGARVGVPTWTFVATALPAVHLGFTPVLLDVDPHTLNLSPASLDAALRGGLDAVVPVHFGGVPVNRAVHELCDAAEVPVIEDAAHALGAATTAARSREAATSAPASRSTRPRT